MGTGPHSSLSVCLLAQAPCDNSTVLGQTSLKLPSTLTVVVARSSSADVVIFCVLPVLLTTPCFHTFHMFSLSRGALCVFLYASIPRSGETLQAEITPLPNSNQIYKDVGCAAEVKSAMSVLMSVRCCLSFRTLSRW